MTAQDLARAASQRAATKRQQSSDNRLVRISGEVVTLANAIERSGLTRDAFNRAYRKGVNTWEGLRR